MGERNIVCVSNPDHVISLKFQMLGQQKFTRAKTLGWYYEENQIRKHIEEYAAFRAGHASRFPKSKLIDTDAKEFRDSEGRTRWSELQNIKEVSRALNVVAWRESTCFKKSYAKKHENELSKYHSLEARLKKIYPDALPKLSDLKAEREELLSHKSKTSAEYKKAKATLTELDSARMEMNNYLRRQNERNAPS